MTTAAGTVTLQDYITAVLEKLNKPATGPNIAVLSALAISEGRGLAGWNPFDTTQPAPGATNFNKVGVKNYTSFQQGVDATAQTFNNGLYDPLLTGLDEQQPASFYTSGPGFVSLKTWQRGPNGPSTPAPAWVRVLASRTQAQLLNYAQMLTASSNTPPPAATMSLAGDAASSPSSSSSDPFGIGAALSSFGTNIGDIFTRAVYFAVAGVLLAVGLALIFGGDLEGLANKAIDKIPPIPVVP